jgi:hypothetical protein
MISEHSQPTVKFYPDARLAVGEKKLRKKESHAISQKKNLIYWMFFLSSMEAKMLA